MQYVKLVFTEMDQNRGTPENYYWCGVHLHPRVPLDLQPAYQPLCKPKHVNVVDVGRPRHCILFRKTTQKGDTNALDLDMRVLSEVWQKHALHPWCQPTVDSRSPMTLLEVRKFSIHASVLESKQCSIRTSTQYFVDHDRRVRPDTLGRY